MVQCMRLFYSIGLLYIGNVLSIVYPCDNKYILLQESTLLWRGWGGGGCRRISANSLDFNGAGIIFLLY